MSNCVGCCLSVDKKEKKVAKLEAKASPGQPSGEGAKLLSITAYLGMSAFNERKLKELLANKMRVRGSAKNVWLTIYKMLREFCD